MISHGINVVALFFIADIIFDRTKTTNISELGGIAKSAPVFSAFFMIVMLANVALPLTNGFIGEFLMLIGLFQYQPVIAIIAGTSIIFGAVYFFWLYQRTIFGEPKSTTENFKDLSGSELIVAIPIVLFIFVIGIYPSFITEIAEPAIKELLKYKL